MARNVGDGRHRRPRVEGFLGIRRVPREFTKNGMQERMQDMMQETLQERMQEFIDANTPAGARMAEEVAAPAASGSPTATRGPAGQPGRGSPRRPDVVELPTVHSTAGRRS
jgi:hypothetical protein